MPKMVSDDEREELLTNSDMIHGEPELYGHLGIEQPTDPIRIMSQAKDRADSERERQQHEADARLRAQRKTKHAQEMEALRQAQAEQRESDAQEERARVVSELRTQYFQANEWATDKDFARALPALLDDRGKRQMVQREQAERASPVYSKIGSGF